MIQPSLILGLNLTLVTLDKGFAEELLDLKLVTLQKDIQNILLKWNYLSVEKFLQDARDGTLEEADDDAITLRHLLDQREELFQLKASWSEKNENLSKASPG